MSKPIQELQGISAVSSLSAVRGDGPRMSAFVAPGPAASAASAPDPAQLQAAVDRLNQHFAERRTDLKFTIDSSLHTVVVSVVDAQDGTVLQQIPSEVAMRIAHYLAETNSGLIQAEA